MTTITDTQRIVYQMMTENTGIHMMDSGGATGRMWQRNQKHTIEDFIEQPKARLDEWGGDISIFHFFSEFLEHDAEMQKKIEDVAELLPHESWFGIREAFIADLLEPPDSLYPSGWTFENTYNTYNDPDSIHLSQTFEGSDLVDPGGRRLLLIMLHNGADVRGGYTKPYAFRYKGDYMDEFMCGMMDYDIFCEKEDCDHSVGVHGVDVIDRDGDWVKDYQIDKDLTCPKCHTVGSLSADVNW